MKYGKTIKIGESIFDFFCCRGWSVGYKCVIGKNVEFFVCEYRYICERYAILYVVKRCSGVWIIKR